MGLIHYTLWVIDHVHGIDKTLHLSYQHCSVPTGCNELDPFNPHIYIISLHHIIKAPTTPITPVTI